MRPFAASDPFVRRRRPKAAECKNHERAGASNADDQLVPGHIGELPRAAVLESIGGPAEQLLRLQQTAEDLSVAALTRCAAGLRRLRRRAQVPIAA
jgi:hypothetical protein